MYKNLATAKIPSLCEAIYITNTFITTIASLLCDIIDLRYVVVDCKL